MASNFHAVMHIRHSSSGHRARAWISLAVSLVLATALIGSAQAERADRTKPAKIDADHSGSLDLQSRVVVFTGNVVFTQGSLVIRAERVEVRETPDGFVQAVAQAKPGETASFRQNRDVAGESIDGQAERLEYDGKTSSIRFIQQAVVRRLRGTTVADEFHGRLIRYDGAAEVFSVEGDRSLGAEQLGARVSATLTPRAASAEGTDAAKAAKPGASR